MQRKHILVLLAVILVALGAVLLLPHGELVQTLAAVPIFGALSAVAVDILREQAKRQKENQLAETQQRFSLAAGSHMASTAFDKHVAFCEEYVAEVLSALRTLFREGPTQEALNHSDRLLQIKQKYVLWITRDVEARLEPFERALRRIGANDRAVRLFPEGEGSVQRMTETYRQFAEVLGTEHMGTEWEGEPITDVAAVSRVVAQMRDILGVEELTRLRAAIVRNALA